MREAVRMLTTDDLADQGILLETYVDGPELDYNFCPLRRRGPLPRTHGRPALHSGRQRRNPGR
jgi:hypothetical protein